MSDRKPTANRSHRGEIMAANRPNNPSVRLNNPLKNMPVRKPLGDPYKGRK